jgi:O-phosphoseryl-tRNA synthetase
MRFDPRYYRDLSREDFERAWYEGLSTLSTPSRSHTYPRLRYTRALPHPVFDTIRLLREVYLSLGFNEAANPVIIEEKEIYKQFGPEASAVLDRVFYLGGLPRPNQGIGAEELAGISRITGRPVNLEEEEKLRVLLQDYKKAKIDGDELTHATSEVLHIDDGLTVEIFEKVFSDFRNLEPQSSRNTLRSHMTSGWFLTLAACWDHQPLPIRLFSVDRCFRREQEEGPTRLMSYHSASCVIAGEDVTNEDGKAVSEALLSAFGYTDFRFQPDEKRSKYYMPGTQTEVYARHPSHNWVEVATFGMYSPSALGEYEIGVPVMNLGLGVERLAMISHNAPDMRSLLHPQFFPASLSDLEIARAIGYREDPRSLEGRHLAEAIISSAVAHGDAPGPCSFLAWEGEIGAVFLNVYVEENESNAKLLGPAGMNEIFVHEGNVLGVPDTEKWQKVRNEGISAGITFIAASAHLAAARIEEAASCGKGTTLQVKIAKLPSDLNLKVAEYAMRYITDNKKKIDVRGPVFLTVRSEVK